MCRQAIIDNGKWFDWLKYRLIVLHERKTQCFHGNHNCCLPSVTVTPEADNQRRLQQISIIHTLQTSPFHCLILSCSNLAQSSNPPVGHTPSLMVCSKENKFHQSNCLVARTLLLSCNIANLQLISSPHFPTHVPLAQITCSLILAALRPCSLAKELEDGSQERRRVGRFS